MHVFVLKIVDLFWHELNDLQFKILIWLILFIHFCVWFIEIKVSRLPSRSTVISSTIELIKFINDGWNWLADAILHITHCNSHIVIVFLTRFWLRHFYESYFLPCAKFASRLDISVNFVPCSCIGSNLNPYLLGDRCNCFQIQNKFRFLHLFDRELCYLHHFSIDPVHLIDLDRYVRIDLI